MTTKLKSLDPSAKHGLTKSFQTSSTTEEVTMHDIAKRQSHNMVWEHSVLTNDLDRQVPLAPGRIASTPQFAGMNLPGRPR